MNPFGRRNAFRILLLTMAFLGLCWSPVLAQEGTGYDATIKAARTSVWDTITKVQGSGASVAIMDKGKLVFSEAMGVRDRALNNPIDSYTRFNIGSISKMFATVAIMLLVDEEKVSLDEPVVTYIPDFSMQDERYQEITVRMLLNHSSGLPGSSFIFSYALEGDPHQILLQTLRREHLKHAPGAASMYCNDGFTLAEIIVERVSGQTFVEFLDQRVFDPLAMHDTGVSLGELPSQTDRADAYGKESGRKYPAEVVQVHGAGGLSSTVEDLCRFGNSFTPFGQKILSEGSLKELRTSHNTPFGEQLRHPPLLDSLGWDYSHLSPYDQNGIQVMGKDGGTAFYSANLQVLPDQGLVIAFLISGNAFSESVMRPILVELLDQKDLASKPSVPVTRPALAQDIPDDFDRYQGTYVNAESSPFKVQITDDRKRVTVVPLKAERDGKSEAAKPVSTFTYHDGVFIEKESKQNLYFTSIDDTNYMVGTPSVGGTDGTTLYEVDSLEFQQIKKIEHPLTLSPLQEDGKQWLLRNLPPSTVLALADLVITPVTYQELNGYVDFAGLKTVESPTHAGMVATHFRDQTELDLSQEHGTRWAQMNIYLYSQTTPAPCKNGTNSVLIGPQGYNEWMEVPEDAILEFGKPTGGRVVVLDPDHQTLYDSVLDDTEVFAPKGSLIFCAGPVSSKFALTLK